jgi:hypothetical protein
MQQHPEKEGLMQIVLATMGSDDRLVSGHHNTVSRFTESVRDAPT